MIEDHEEWRRDHKQLLKAQVLLTGAQRKSEEGIAALAAAQAATDKRLEAMIAQQAERGREIDGRFAKMVSAVGELIRRMPLPPEAHA